MTTTTDVTTVDVEVLHVDAIHSTPRPFTWEGELLDREGLESDGTWRYWEPVEAADYADPATVLPDGLVLVVESGSVLFDDTCPTCAGDGCGICDDTGRWSLLDDIREAVEQSSEGPMMSYWYPFELPGEPEACAAVLVGLPLCVVEVDGVAGLALTGGGMDLSWEICEAFIRLGSLPPFHFADLSRSRMCGRGDLTGGGEDLPYSAIPDRDRVIITAAVRSCAVLATWAADTASRVAAMGGATVSA
jgi:hypothetical protein